MIGSRETGVIGREKNIEAIAGGEATDREIADEMSISEHAVTPATSHTCVKTEACRNTPAYAVVTSPTALISGTVYKGAKSYDNGVDTPIPRAMVSAWRGKELIAAAETDEKGEYVLSLPVGKGYTLKVALRSHQGCYDTKPKKWGIWSTVVGQCDDIRCPADSQDIGVEYRMLNYGPKNISWELWHTGPIFNKANVVLVHGFRFPWSSTRGKCDKQFAGLAELLQTIEDQYNVWQFEYEDGFWGTLGSMSKYASRLGEAVDRIAKITGNETCSIVAISMGGIIARKYIAMGGESRIDKLLTIATPNMGTLKLQPLRLKWINRFVPRATGELRPDSRLLWDLNTETELSSVPEFATVAGYSRGHTDGMVELSSAKLVESNADGSVAKKVYFAGVNRSHRSISDIRNKHDEVFQLIRSFLRGGVAGISEARVTEEPGDYSAHSFLTFALTEKPRWGMVYPAVVVANTGHRYLGFKVFSQGDRTEDGSYIFTVRLRPDDEGESRIYFGAGKYATVQVHRGQSTVVTEPIHVGSHYTIGRINLQHALKGPRISRDKCIPVEETVSAQSDQLR